MMKVKHGNKFIETDSRYIHALLDLLVTYGRCHTVAQVGNGTATHYFKCTARVRRIAYQELGLHTEVRNNAVRGGKLGEYLIVINKRTAIKTLRR